MPSDEDTISRERTRCVEIIKARLLHNDQRVVSWHEVADCLAAIHSGDQAPVPPPKVMICFLCRKPIMGKVYNQGGPVHGRCRIVIKRGPDGGI